MQHCVFWMFCMHTCCDFLLQLSTCKSIDWTHVSESDICFESAWKWQYLCGFLWLFFICQINTFLEWSDYGKHNCPFSMWFGLKYCSTDNLVCARIYSNSIHINIKLFDFISDDNVPLSLLPFAFICQNIYVLEINLSILNLWGDINIFDRTLEVDRIYERKVANSFVTEKSSEIRIYGYWCKNCATYCIDNKRTGLERMYVQLILRPLGKGFVPF